MAVMGEDWCSIIDKIKEKIEYDQYDIFKSLDGEIAASYRQVIEAELDILNKIKFNFINKTKEEQM